MSTYVLVHGAWHGGWAWCWVRDILEQRGHCVFTPTLMGLGERQSLMSSNLSMNDMVEDMAATIENEDLNDVILVGHSFGGTVVTGVAERVPGRIKRLVYLDAALLEDGESMFSLIPNRIVAERQRSAQESSGGLSLPVPEAEAFGLVPDDKWEFVKERLTPHPVSSYTTPLTLDHPSGEGFPCCYILCINPRYLPLAWAYKRAIAYGWPILKINTGHDAMISAPEDLSEILMELP